MDFANEVKKKIGGKVVNSKDNLEINLDDFKGVLDDSSLKARDYDFDNLKDIDSYYSLWSKAKVDRNAELEKKYGDRLYSVVYDVQENHNQHLKLVETKKSMHIGTSVLSSKGIKSIILGKYTPLSETGYSNCVGSSSSGEMNAQIVVDSSGGKSYLVLFDNLGIVRGTFSLDKNNGNCHKLSEINFLDIKFEKATIENYNNEYKNPEVSGLVD